MDKEQPQPGIDPCDEWKQRQIEKQEHEAAAPAIARMLAMTDQERVDAGYPF